MFTLGQQENRKWNNNAIVMIFIIYFDYLQYVQDKCFGQRLNHYQCEILQRKYKYKVILKKLITDTILATGSRV